MFGMASGRRQSWSAIAITLPIGSCPSHYEVRGLVSIGSDFKEAGDNPGNPQSSGDRREFSVGILFRALAL
jgi:hypothetical protein